MYLPKKHDHFTKTHTGSNIRTTEVLETQIFMPRDLCLCRFPQIPYSNIKAVIKKSFAGLNQNESSLRKKRRKLFKKNKNKNQQQKVSFRDRKT